MRGRNAVGGTARRIIVRTVRGADTAARGIRTAINTSIRLVAVASFVPAILAGCATPERVPSGAANGERLKSADVFRLLEACRRQHASEVSSESLSEFVRDLTDLRRLADDQRRRRDGMRRAMNTYSQGVCLIHGTFTLKESRGGELVPVTGADGEPLELEYFGSGFLADERGYVLTNRHVAEPWWRNESVAPLLALGMKPGFVRLTAAFPGREPVEVDATSIRVSPDGLDLAVFVAPIDGVPVLPLHEGDVRELRGQGVMLLGYPTGLKGLLARADPELVQQALSNASDVEALVRELSVAGALAPIATHGALNDVTSDKLLYDAVTTSGGSGGPVFGPDGDVVAVNYAVLRDFQGVNFGVPIGYARPLLDHGGPSPVEPQRRRRK
jgi:S1-C subfamily serine protease